MKWATLVLAMVTVLGMASVTMAKSSSTKVSGTFERMDGPTIILSSVKDGSTVEIPVVTNKDTKVTIDGETKMLADLTQGMHLKIKTPNGLATEVVVKTKTAAKKKAPATQPSAG